MIKVRMLKDDRGHDVDVSGIICPIKEYAKGQEYLLGEDLARCFLSLKSAEEVKPAAVKAPAPESKDMGRAPQNKGRA